MSYCLWIRQLINLSMIHDYVSAGREELARCLIKMQEETQALSTLDLLDRRYIDFKKPLKVSIFPALLLLYKEVGSLQEIQLIFVIKFSSATYIAITQPRAWAVPEAPGGDQ